jgi:hypothetical protein
MISAHAVVLLEVADDGLDGGPPFEFALDLRRDAALLAAGVDLELVIGWGVVAAIAGISDAAIKQYNMPTYPHKRWQFATTATLRPPRFSGFRRREAELFPTRGVKLPCLSTRSQSFVDVAFRPDLGALRKSPACPRPTPKNQ